MKDFGVFLIDKQEEKEIDELLCGAVYRAYAPLRVARGQFREAFRHLRLGKRFISHPTSFKRKLWRGLEKTLHMKSLLTSRCAPTVLPTCDYMNLSHREWRDAQRPTCPGGTACTSCSTAPSAAQRNTWTACRAFGTARAPRPSCLR